MDQIDPVSHAYNINESRVETVQFTRNPYILVCFMVIYEPTPLVVVKENKN